MIRLGAKVMHVTSIDCWIFFDRQNIMGMVAYILERSVCTFVTFLILNSINQIAIVKSKFYQQSIEDNNF